VSAETQTAQVSVTVDIAPELQNRFQTNDTLFIYAKAASGPPMPLAAVRQPASGFPVKVVLDDSHAMMPSLKLSNFQQVVVGARISKGGDVRAQSGDLETLSAPLAIDNGPVSIQLTVDQVVP
ncbi:MAG: c-type cytochrome biogenesis protein CcmI, partial [Candidatus Competibacteraceae bacterium]|nr:c-type cytochrome biogenesis protein CcmI [Candidatus Competibacteraceae bacterium]